MKLSPYYFTPVILLGVLALGPGCPSKSTNVAPTTAGSATVSVLDVSPSIETVPSGKSKHLTAVATFGDGSKKDVTKEAQWASDNPKTATVDDKGTVVGVSTGITSVKVIYGGAKASTSVTVTP
jgi:hypothetical protein